jgi:hypothetical protein
MGRDRRENNGGDIDNSESEQGVKENRQGELEASLQ